MGARPEDYQAAAPPGSYISVEDFQSPQDLGEFLNVLDKDDELYNKYFRWKGTGSFIDTKFWCRLCAMLHAVDYTGQSTWYRDLLGWWSGTEEDRVCLKKPPKDSNTWVSWRVNSTQKPK